MLKYFPQIITNPKAFTIKSLSLNEPQRRFFPTKFLKILNIFLKENTKSEAVPEIVKTNAKDHHKFKTVLCLKWETYGGCPYGKKCRFAHVQQLL